ncbi:hypothetical protein FisN_20Lh081 [Fistulifera solaris]|uniref:Uncharacterized protein n=1 Tax=Fistulifera solaris TaxID=1519565 RepID=A0A1Z5JDA2_FISSO|nr:hypothetical protein FisN_20Lh081 [Fistulifera solaris]|eukprot:GAX11862.1 hypothetical protein FisN_20Lh081 [Fistulifera solaris]
MSAPEEKDDILQVHPTKQLNVIVHDAHFIGGEAFNQRWSFALAIYRLRRPPKDMIEILEGCAPGLSLRPKLLQLTEHALLYLLPLDSGLYWSDERQWYRHKLSITISTGRRSNSNERNVYNVHIMGVSPSATAEALLKVLRYPTQQMLTIGLGIRSDIITTLILQKILCECGGSCREFLFSHEALSSDECYRLARHASKLVFQECIFLDSGAAFLRGVQEREEHLSVAFLGRDRPFPDFIPLLRCANLYELELRHGFSLTELECQVLADASVESMTLDECRLHNHGKSLFMAIAKGKGPRHLRVRYWDETEQQKDHSLVSALSATQCQLESIGLMGPKYIPNSVSWQTMLQAILVTNHSLQSLELDSFQLTDELWNIFLDTLEQSTTIRRLSLLNMTSTASDQHGCLARSRRLVDILPRKRNLEDIEIAGDCPFEPAQWSTQIVPLVQENRYRNCFGKLQRDPHGAALLAHAMARPKLQNEHISYAFLLLESSVNLLAS